MPNILSAIPEKMQSPGASSDSGKHSSRKTLLPLALRGADKSPHWIGYLVILK
jgi:hypothetical protein